MSEPHSVPANILNLVHKHCNAHGEASGVVSHYEQYGCLPDTFRDKYYSRFFLAEKQAVEGNREPQPLLF